MLKRNQKNKNKKKPTHAGQILDDIAVRAAIMLKENKWEKMPREM